MQSRDSKRYSGAVGPIAKYHGDDFTQHSLSSASFVYRGDFDGPSAAVGKSSEVSRPLKKIMK